jgi:hypothetical protein
VRRGRELPSLRPVSLGWQTRQQLRCEVAGCPKDTYQQTGIEVGPSLRMAVLTRV